MNTRRQYNDSSKDENDKFFWWIDVLLPSLHQSLLTRLILAIHSSWNKILCYWDRITPDKNPQQKSATGIRNLYKSAGRVARCSLWLQTFACPFSFLLLVTAPCNLADFDGCRLMLRIFGCGFSMLQIFVADCYQVLNCTVIATAELWT